jgi:valyl-tRNA synthetase
MDKINELNEAVQKVVLLASEIQSDIAGEVINKAPQFIHQRFCAKLVEVMKEQPNKAASEVPKAMEVITSINILEELYPEVKH